MLSTQTNKLMSALVTGVLAASSTVAQATPVTKTNSLEVYMHYMPWFETPETTQSGNWGFHWTMNSEDPNIIEPNGQRQISSHYYPKIGPYASGDPDVIEYHMLLMKLSGVDGVIIDWYGTAGTNGDINSLLSNSNAIADRVGNYGLEFGVMFEDRFATGVQDSATNMAYLRDNYFNRPEYIRRGPDNDPLVMVFGPITNEQPSDWDTIVGQAGEDIELLPLWFQGDEVGANGDGEFAWISEDDLLNDHLTRQQNFLQNRSQTLGVAAASAYPGFDSFYAEAGINNGITLDIPHDDDNDPSNGNTLSQVLDQVSLYQNNIDMLQLNTFNDFGEGTIFEPTEEFGFQYLMQVQDFTGVSFGEAELQLVLDLFNARKDFEGDALAQAQLDLAAMNINQLQFGTAQNLINQVNGIPEPSSVMLMLVAIGPLARRRRR